MLPRPPTLVAALAAFSACGGTVVLNDYAGDPSPHSGAATPSGTQELLIALDGSTPSPRPIVCTSCTGNADCGATGAACVAAADGNGFCAPGCNKEGFCTPDRVCTWVGDPAGKPWRACVPLLGATCAPPPSVPRPQRRDTNAGTRRKATYTIAP